MPSPPELVFFTDRNLARQFPEVLRKASLTVIAYHESFPEDDRLADPVWLRFACSRGYVCLSHDKAIRRDEETVGEVFDPAHSPLGSLFILRGQLVSTELAEMLLSVIGRIERMVWSYRKQGRAFIATVRRVTVKGGREKVEVVRWSDAESWHKRMRKRSRQDGKL